MALWVHGLPVFYLKALLCEKCLNSVIFCGLYFPIFGLNTEICKINFRIESEFEKMETRKTPSLDTFHLTCGYHKHTYWLLLIHTPKKIFERK